MSKKEANCAVIYKPQRLLIVVIGIQIFASLVILPLINRQEIFPIFKWSLFSTTYRRLRFTDIKVCESREKSCAWVSETPEWLSEFRRNGFYWALLSYQEKSSSQKTLLNRQICEIKDRLNLGKISLHQRTISLQHSEMFRYSTISSQAIEQEVCVE